MKINEVMAEASVDRKQFGKETVRANQKANIARSAAFRAQMDAPTEPAATHAAAPATPKPAATNYGAGGAGIPQTQVTPISKVTGKPAGVTPAAGTPSSDITLTNPISNTGATPAAPAAGATAGVTSNGRVRSAPKSRFPNLQKIATGAGQVASGVGGALGSVFKGVGDAVKAGGGANTYGSLAQIQDTSTSATGQPTAPTTAEPSATSTTPGQPATPVTAKPGQPVTAKPGQPGGATPDLSAKPQTQDSPIAQPGATPDLGAKPQTQDSPVTKPAAEPATAKAPAAAQGKTMSKQDILSWISRNDEDNAGLRALKDAIAAAEKSTPTPTTAAKSDYSKATPGMQNIQATPGKVSYAPKTAAPAAPVQQKQPQMASKQYKKAPL